MMTMIIQEHLVCSGIAKITCHTSLFWQLL